jgi:hypothetical protein
MQKFYIIEDRFKAVVIDYEYEYRIKFGGLKHCIDISVYKDDPDPNINGLSFNKKCSMDVDLVSGEGTIEMAKTAIKFVKTMFSETRNFMFKDHSKITCHKNIIIPLYYYYLIKHGQTWYQSKFDAKQVIKEEQKFIDQLIFFMKNEPMLPFDEFYKEYIHKSRIANFKEFISPTYNNSNSYYEFMKKLIDENDCGILQSWFSYFCSKHCQFNFGESNWYINSRTIDTWNSIKYSETPNSFKFLKVQNAGAYKSYRAEDFIRRKRKI